MLVGYDVGGARRGAYQILDPLEQLDEQLPALVLGQLLLRDDEVEELSLRGQLQYQIHGISFVERVLQAQHVGVADAHENGNFLLQAVRLGALLHARRLGKNLHGVPLAAGLLHAKEDFGKVALTQLLEKRVLLVEGTGRPAPGILEDEPGLVQNRNFVLLLQLSPLVPANHGLVHEGTIT